MSWYNPYPQWQYPQWQPMFPWQPQGCIPWQPQGWNPQGFQPTYQPQPPQNIGFGGGSGVSMGTDILGILGFGILPWMALRGLSGN